MMTAPAAVTTQSTLLEEEYQGRTITVLSIRRQQAAYTSSGTYRDGTPWSLDHSATDYTSVIGRIDGKGNVRVNGAKHDDPKAVLKQAKRYIDEAEFDNSVRADVTTLVDAVKNFANAGLEKVDVSTPVTHPQAFLNQVVYVYAMGYWRRGRVTKVGNKRVTVSYTTASSDGRIFHKSASQVAR